MSGTESDYRSFSYKKGFILYLVHYDMEIDRVIFLYVKAVLLYENK